MEKNLRVQYRHNNSGGYDWLTTADWKNLTDAGWVITDRNVNHVFTADRTGLSLVEAIVEWHRVTGKNPAEEGCNCCGKPHNFILVNDEDEILAEMRLVHRPPTWEIFSYV